MKKYGVFYVDPPWKYDFARSDNRKIENHYPTMEVEEICNLPVKEMSNDNAVLYLWATAPKLLEALRVMDAWGFKYVSHAIWDKGSYGMGYWFRIGHEILLVGKKGKFSPPIPAMRKKSIFFEKKSKHSRKPDMFRTLIRQWFPNEDRIEMFARESSSKHWDVWGNEVEPTHEMP